MNVDKALSMVETADLPSVVETTLAAEVRRLRDELERDHAHHDDDQRMMLRWVPELERLRDKSPTVPCQCGRTLHIPGVAELAAKVEAGATVVRAWARYRALPVRGDLAAALNELVRVYGEGD